MNPTAFDFAVLALLSLSLAVGAWRGVVGELLALAAWLAAFLAARSWGFAAGELALPATLAPLARQLLGMLAVFVGVLMLFALLRWMLARLLGAVGLRPLDRLLGALFGIARGILLVWLAVLLAGLSELPRQPWWRQATFATPFEMAVLAARPWLPVELARRLHYR